MCTWTNAHRREREKGIDIMKKIINAPEAYTDDMLKGIYAAHGDMVKYVRRRVSEPLVRADLQRGQRG